MKKIGNSSARSSRIEGFSVLDLMIVVVIVSIIVSYILAQVSTIQKPLARSNAAQRLTMYIQNARSDSIRRHADDFTRMAQITVIDEHSYNVSLDANGDGSLDPPIFVDLKEQNVRIDGPFPRMYMFDSLGRTVDPARKPVTFASITMFNGSGKSVVNVTTHAR